MDIKEIAYRRVYLEARLNSLRMMNVYGADIEELTKREIDRIESQMELNSVLNKIKSYEEQPQTKTGD